MLGIEIDEAAGIAILEPAGELSESDFQMAARTIDPYIEEHGGLKGIVIHVEHFPGWDSFASLVSHLEFIREHHRKLSRIAFATDSAIGAIAENIASHFVSAEIRNFDFAELQAAKMWIVDGDAWRPAAQ